MLDFIVVGGGIAGVSLAAELAPLGSLVLLEAETALGYHTSGRSAALYEPGYGKPPVAALTEASGPLLTAAGVLSPRGLLLIARPDQSDGFDHDIAAMGMTEIGPDAAQAMVPLIRREVVARAAYFDRAQDIDTDRLLQGCARTARAARGRIVTGARVTAIERTGGGWRVATGPGAEVFEARVLVNAAGAWVDHVAAMAGIASPGFTPLRRSMARVPAPAGVDVSRWPMMFGPGEDWYAKPDAGALIVSPAEEHPMEPHDAWADDMVLAEGIARFEEMVAAPVTRLIGSWAGLRTFARDRLLVIGPDPVDPAFVWQAGQGGYGFQTSLAAARLGADVIAGRTPVIAADLAAALSPRRFA